MLVILDGGVSRQARAVFQKPRAVIGADRPDEVPGALAALEAALAGGAHVAGWLGYELGYALEPRLAPHARGPAGGALLRLGVFGPPEPGLPEPVGRAYAGPLRLGWDAPAYARAFAEVKAFIAAGDIYQANLSFRAAFPFAGEPRALYETLRAASGAGHCAFVDDGARQIVSLSPELFFELTDGIFTVRPMKGTARRLGDDAAERARLATSAKDRAENLMIVDLIRNDLARLAESGSVAVPRLFEIETYPTLHTMVSTVTARKRPGVGAGDILRALFPCGSVTGAPKIRAMEILHALEAGPRGPYCGAIGHFAPDGSARFNVAIRTLTITGGRGELGIGGGVVQDSDAAREYDECRLKARFFEAARRPLELIETLRFENGFIRMEAHLDRMAKSAPVFGLAFDAGAARAALQEAVAGRRGPSRVRLTLDEAGRHKASAHDLAPDPSHWTYALSRARTHSADLLLRHKTNWRDLYDGEAARAETDEILFTNERGELTEGARSNVFVRRGDELLTPPLAAGLLPGCLRAALIAQGKAREAVLYPADLEGEVLLGNSLRGLIAARRA